MSRCEMGWFSCLREVILERSLTDIVEQSRSRKHHHLHSSLSSLSHQALRLVLVITHQESLTINPKHQNFQDIDKTLGPSVQDQALSG